MSGRPRLSREEFFALTLDAKQEHDRETIALRQFAFTVGVFDADADAVRHWHVVERALRRVCSAWGTK